MLQFLRDGIEDARKIPPVMNFTEHALLGHSIFKFLEKLTYGPCPHVHIVLQDTELSLTKFVMHGDRIFNLFTTVDDLLT